ncbi:hypothetical protein [Campylobacter concisus]|uniref:hypothetical protein n=1 Tax=Campylobacter concisus TaxID=199 RepID=UPI003D1E9E27
MKINKILFLIAIFLGFGVANAQDSFQHIRNATAKINYAGVNFFLHQRVNILALRGR